MLTERENQILDALLARIVPADDFPSAIEAGAGEFVRGRAAIQLELYQTGLLLLDERDFTDLTDSEQDALLAEFESHGSIALIISHTLEGYYTREAGMALVGFRVTA